MGTHSFSIPSGHFSGYLSHGAGAAEDWDLRVHLVLPPLRPDAFLAFVEVKYPLSLVFAATTLLGSLRYLPQAGAILRAPTSRYLLLLQIPVGLSILFALQPDLDMERYTYYVRVLVVLFLIPVLVRTEKDLRQIPFHHGPVIGPSRAQVRSIWSSRRRRGFFVIDLWRFAGRQQLHSFGVCNRDSAVPGFAVCSHPTSC